MKKLFCVLLFILLMGCGKGYPWDSYQGEECCRDHGGGGYCFYSYNYTYGYLKLDDHGHILCNDKDAKGNNYQCPGECK